uniref:Uncharacterized protein n=1 Tax=Oryza brachyantha TaxID=4533 RepID=J3N7U2_ORYBR
MGKLLAREKKLAAASSEAGAARGSGATCAGKGRTGKRRPAVALVGSGGDWARKSEGEEAHSQGEGDGCLDLEEETTRPTNFEKRCRRLHCDRRRHGVIDGNSGGARFAGSRGRRRED